jgi:putative SOS response-associated peptidase YedK
VVLTQEGKRNCIPMRWGLIPYWWNKPLKEMRMATFNARAETVTTKPMFREAFPKKRCLIPASGYYEWQDSPNGKQPYYFTRRDGAPVTIAGLWDRWRPDRGADERILSCTMIITGPNPFVAEVHDRMPVILEEKHFEPWLSGEAGTEMSKPAANNLLQRWPVSTRVNSSRAGAEDPHAHRSHQALTHAASEKNALRDREYRTAPVLRSMPRFNQVPRLEQIDIRTNDTDTSRRLRCHASAHHS